MDKDIWFIQFIAFSPVVSTEAGAFFGNDGEGGYFGNVEAVLLTAPQRGRADGGLGRA